MRFGTGVYRRSRLTCCRECKIQINVIEDCAVQRIVRRDIADQWARRELLISRHAHSDHYTNLSKSWNHGPIYCSQTTANLIVHMLGVEPQWVHGLPDNVPFVMPNTGGVKVTNIEANHCESATEGCLGVCCINPPHRPTRMKNAHQKAPALPSSYSKVPRPSTPATRASNPPTSVPSASFDTCTAATSARVPRWYSTLRSPGRASTLAT